MLTATMLVVLAVSSSKPAVSRLTSSRAARCSVVALSLRRMIGATEARNVSASAFQAPRSATCHGTMAPRISPTNRT